MPEASSWLARHLFVSVYARLLFMARIAIMKAASISQAKDGLSSLLDRVKAGETVLITDRGVAVARLEPVVTSADSVGRLERLARSGLVTPGSGSLPAEFFDGPTVRIPTGVSVVEGLLEERGSGW